LGARKVASASSWYCTMALLSAVDNEPLSCLLSETEEADEAMEAVDGTLCFGCDVDAGREKCFHGKRRNAN
jgi:hypothetical protein